MPNPNVWDDVRVSAFRTEALVDELIRMSLTLTESMAVLTERAAVSFEHWHGPHRWAFESQFAQLLAAMDVAANWCRFDATRVRAAFADGQTEQAERLRIRGELLSTSPIRPAPGPALPFRGED